MPALLNISKDSWNIISKRMKPLSEIMFYQSFLNETKYFSDTIDNQTISTMVKDSIIIPYSNDMDAPLKHLFKPKFSMLHIFRFLWFVKYLYFCFFIVVTSIASSIFKFFFSECHQLFFGKPCGAAALDFNLGVHSFCLALFAPSN